MEFKPLPPKKKEKVRNGPTLIERLPMIWIVNGCFLVYGLYLLQFDTGTYMDIVLTKIAAAAVIINVCMFAYLQYKDAKRHTVCGLFSVSFGLVAASSYAMVLDDGNLLQYIVGYIALVICAMNVTCGYDLLLGRDETAQLLKPLALILVAITLISILVDPKIYINPELILETYKVNLISVPLILLVFFTLSDKKVMEQTPLSKIVFPRILMYACALFIFGFMYILQYIVGDTDTQMNLDLAASIIIAAIGLFLIVYRDIDALTSMSLVIFLMGISIILDFILDLGSTDLITFTIALVMMLCGVGCVILGIMMYSGDKYNVQRTRYLLAIMIVIYAIPIVLKARETPDLDYLRTTVLDNFMILVLIIFQYIALTEPSIRYHSVKERMAYNVKVMNYAICNDDEAYILRNDLKSLMNPSGWTDYPEGPIEKKKTVPVYISGSYSTIILQKWRGTGDVTCEVVHSEGGTYIQALRFYVRQVVHEGTIDDCTSLTIYGDDGFFMTVLIGDIDSKRKTDLPHRLFYMVLGH